MAEPLAPDARPGDRLASLDAGDADDEGVLEVAGAALDAETEVDLDGVHELVLDGCTLDEVELHLPPAVEVTLVDGALRGCRLVGGEVVRAERVALERCQVRATTFAEGRLVHVRFADGDLREVSLRQATLEHVRFEACDLTAAGFDGATLRGVAFPGCDLADATFHHLDAAEVDLTGARVEDVVAPGDLRGCTLTVAQATALAVPLAKAAGVTVVDGPA